MRTFGAGLGVPRVFITCILNQCPGDLGRLLVETGWRVSTGGPFSAATIGESDGPSWGHYCLRTGP